MIIHTDKVNELLWDASGMMQDGHGKKIEHEYAGMSCRRKEKAQEAEPTVSGL